MNTEVRAVMHGLYNARPTVTFPAAGRHHPLIGTKLYSSVTEDHVCEQLAWSCYAAAHQPNLTPNTNPDHNNPNFTPTWGRLGSRVVSVLDLGAEGPGFKSQSRRCRVTVLGKLFTSIVPLFTKQQNW